MATKWRRNDGFTRWRNNGGGTFYEGRHSNWNTSLDSSGLKEECFELVRKNIEQLNEDEKQHLKISILNCIGFPGDVSERSHNQG